MRIEIGRAYRQHGASRSGAAQRCVDLNQRLRKGAVNANFLDDAYDLVSIGTVIPDVLTHRVFVGPEMSRQSFIDKDNWPAFGIFIASEGAAAQNGNAHGSKIVTANDGPIDIDQVAPLSGGLALDRNIGGPTAAESGQLGG